MYIIKATDIKKGLPSHIAVFPDCKYMVLVGKENATRFNNIMGASAVADKIHVNKTEIIEVNK
jgi:hypothetical protein